MLKKLIYHVFEVRHAFVTSHDYLNKHSIQLSTYGLMQNLSSFTSPMMTF